MKKEKEKEKKKKRTRQATAPAEQPQDLTAFPQEEALQLLHQKLGGKWKMRILWTLRGRKSIRYGEIKSGIPGITDMMLSQSLRELCADGLVDRHQFQEIPPRVEYQITPLGFGALPGVELLAKWITNNF